MEMEDVHSYVRSALCEESTRFYKKNPNFSEWQVKGW